MDANKEEILDLKINHLKEKIQRIEKEFDVHMEIHAEIIGTQKSMEDRQIGMEVKLNDLQAIMIGLKDKSPDFLIKVKNGDTKEILVSEATKDMWEFVSIFKTDEKGKEYSKSDIKMSFDYLVSLSKDLTFFKRHKKKLLFCFGILIAQQFNLWAIIFGMILRLI